jgi:putative addiction module killer protein
MDWLIKYVEFIDEWLENLTTHQLKSVAKELRLLELSGNKLKLPHSKALGDKLFELRERKFGYRLYYTFDHSKVVLLLYAGDKSSQKRDIKKAKEILKKNRSNSYEN